MDDQPAKIEGGRVAIKGALGSMHTVRVTAGGPEKSFEIAVTEGGARPAKIEMTPPESKPDPLVKPAHPAGKPLPAKTTSPPPPLDLRTNR